MVFDNTISKIIFKPLIHLIFCAFIFYSIYWIFKNLILINKFKKTNQNKKWNQLNYPLSIRKKLHKERIDSNLNLKGVARRMKL
jgi:hypothetical protein